MKVQSLLGIAALSLVAANAQAQNLPLDPGPDYPPLSLFSTFSNDGYNSFRGTVFQANNSFTVVGADLWTAAPSSGLNATFELYEVVNTNGNVLAGATLLGSFGATLTGPIGWYGGDFAAGIPLSAGSNYFVRAGYQEAADENWFFEFDPLVFGHAPSNIGDVTIIDGTLGGDTGNFVMPFLNLRVPAPSSAALLGLAGLALRRRR